MLLVVTEPYSTQYALNRRQQCTEQTLSQPRPSCQLNYCVRAWLFLGIRPTVCVGSAILSIILTSVFGAHSGDCHFNPDCVEKSTLLLTWIYRENAAPIPPQIYRCWRYMEPISVALIYTHQTIMQALLKESFINRES